MFAGVFVMYDIKKKMLLVFVSCMFAGVSVPWCGRKGYWTLVCVSAVRLLVSLCCGMILRASGHWFVYQLYVCWCLCYGVV